MRVHLKGLNHATKCLADGRRVIYWYAWRGGPLLPGEPGSPEFMAAYNEAVARKVTPPTGTLSTILQKYQSSASFLGLAPRTRKDYIGMIALIEARFATFPVVALGDPRTRGVFREWRDELAKRSLRQAGYAWDVLACVLAWAIDGGMVPANPCKAGGRIYSGTRREQIWTADDEVHFLARAPAYLHLPLLLGLYSAQREGDLLRLPWSAYDGTFIRLRQGKTGAFVEVPVLAPLKAALDAAAKTRTGPVILANRRGRPWTSAAFQMAWKRACVKADVVGVTFHDLRGTAVTRFAAAGLTVPEIAHFTGHSLREAEKVLDRHYLARDRALAVSALRKLEPGTDF